MLRTYIPGSAPSALSAGTVHGIRTACDLIVMPRSRSMSIRSRYCARIARSSTTPVSWSIRSASVDFPWSMWAMMQKLRISSGGVAAGGRAVEVGGTEILVRGMGSTHHPMARSSGRRLRHGAARHVAEARHPERSLGVGAAYGREPAVAHLVRHESCLPRNALVEEREDVARGLRRRIGD